MFTINGKKYKTLEEFGFASLAPASKVAKVTPGPGELPEGPCRGLWVGTPGAADLVMADGTIATDFPLLVGWNPFSVQEVTAADADNIWAVY